MRYLFFIVFLLPFLGNAQKEPDFGEIRADNSFNCGGIAIRDSILFGVNEICNSKNHFEFRLSSFYRPGLTRELIILSYNNSSWDIRKYTVKPGSFGLQKSLTSFDSLYENNPVASLSFHIILDTLKNNKAFLIPSQSELKDKLQIFDGPLYIIAFKLGNKFRSYRYENPEIYIKEFPGISEYVKLKNIITILKNFFTP